MTRRRASAATVEYVATQQFAYERTDGSVHRWHQEDESSVTKREDAIAMLQRTIDFWVPKLARDLQVERNVSAAQAIVMARTIFQETVPTLLKEPFPVKWEISMADLTFPSEI